MAGRTFSGDSLTDAELRQWIGLLARRHAD
jgi:hypothetical protein